MPSRSRRSTSTSTSTSTRAAMEASALLPAFFLRRGLYPLLVGLLVVTAYAASYRFFFAKQDTVYTFEVVNEYNHDPEAFTQSSVRKVHIQSGKVLQLHQMDEKYFGEGLTLLNHRLFQVSWRITSGFIYDVESLSLLGSFKHPMTDGWGLATDGKVIYGSDGTSTIYVMQPTTFKEERRLLVRDQNKEIGQLNELEYIGGELWANVWLTDCIVRISPENGQVLGWILLHELRSNLLGQGNKHIDVLNGIAWDEDQKRLFVTGKNWPKLYEIKVHPHPGDFKDHKGIWKRCKVH